jgi:hypothetical protein
VIHVIQRKAVMAAGSDVIVIASAKAIPGNRKELERALRDVAEQTRAQAGLRAGQPVSFGGQRLDHHRL